MFPFHLIIFDHQSKPPEQLFSMIDYKNPIIEQHYWALKNENYNVDFLLDELSLAIIPTAIQKQQKRAHDWTDLDVKM